MMIKRHNIKKGIDKTQRAVDMYSNMVKEQLVSLEKGDNIELITLKDFIEVVMLNSLVSNPSKPLVYTCLVYEFDIGLAHFKQVLTEAEKIEVSIGNRLISIPTIESNYKANAASWIRLFSIASIMKDKQKIQQVMPILDHIHEEDRFASTWAKYLGALYQGDEAKRLEMLEILNEDAKTDQGVFIGLEGNTTTEIPGRAESLSRISLPWIHLYELAHANDEDKFNEKLRDYLSDKKDYIIQLSWEKKRKYWIDLFSTACCSYAMDNGVSIHVESDYIPRWLIDEDLSQYDLVF